MNCQILLKENYISKKVSVLNIKIIIQALIVDSGVNHLFIM